MLQDLVDPEWALRLCADRDIWNGNLPLAVAPNYFRHERGRRAVAGYTADWGEEYWMGEADFCISIEADEPEPEIFVYPDDPRLPGLKYAASPTEAQALLASYVGLRPFRLRVRAVRYRATTRAVLRYNLAWPRGQVRRMDVYGRAMRPENVGRWLSALELMQASDFILPRCLGVWHEGGVLWMDRIPGKNLRSLIDGESAPDPGVVLAAIGPYWSKQVSLEGEPVPNVTGGLERLFVLLKEVVPAEELARFDRLFAALSEFAASWKPTGLAHNDFYDDQILMVDDRPALVDFEEAGIGDALLDVGYFLGHLRWRARSRENAEPHRDYHRRFLEAVTASFPWAREELAVREAYALFRLSGNPIRTLSQEGYRRVVLWLEAAQAAFEGQPA